MKKYLIISIIINIVLSLISFYGLINYLVYSATNSLSMIYDTLFLISIVLVSILINYLIYRKLIKENKKIFYILIPSSVFMFIQALLFLFIK